MINTNDSKIIFMGTPVFADVILNALLEKKYSILSVYAQPDKKTGRKHLIKKPAVKLTAEKNNIPVFQPQKLDASAVLEIKKQNPDLIIVAAYGKILPGKILRIPRFGSINVHASLLPELRGPSPIQNALLQDKKETGATIMLMDEGIDTGDILSQKKISVRDDETYPELYRKLSFLSSGLLINTLPDWINKKITPLRQNDSSATFCKPISRADGQIDWTEDAGKIYNKFRAFTPWPGIFSYWEKNGKKTRLKLTGIYFDGNMPAQKYPPGRVFLSNDNIGIQAGNGIIVIENIQIEGGSEMKIRDFLNGYPDFIGSILK